MKKSLNDLLPSFWKQPEYTNAWRLYVESMKDKRLLLNLVLRHLPEKLGYVDFLQEFSDELFIVLFSHDLENEVSKVNEARVLSILAETGTIKFFGAEGGAGKLYIELYREVPDAADPFIRRNAAMEFMQKKFLFAPIEYVAITSKNPILVWGIEDEELYLTALNKHNARTSDYWDVIERRLPILFKNLFAKMRELDITIAGMNVSPYNFYRGHDWLLEKQITHAGVFASSVGRSRRGWLDKQLREFKLSSSEETQKEISKIQEEISKWKSAKS